MERKTKKEWTEVNIWDWDGLTTCEIVTKLQAMPKGMKFDSFDESEIMFVLERPETDTEFYIRRDKDAERERVAKELRKRSYLELQKEFGSPE